ncbi:MAG: hypothetical protein JSU63_02715 [Phycisphaerales bacterium]|nr:MAG: hypothetical protein JSU63_02715 [Phycisphaerales bacterium]
MKTDSDVSTSGQARRTRRQAVLALLILFPLLQGGCPEFRNDIVDVIETATRSALLTDETPYVISDAATVGFVDATLDLFFDQFRAD